MFPGSGNVVGIVWGEGWWCVCVKWECGRDCWVCVCARTRAPACLKVCYMTSLFPRKLIVNLVCLLKNFLEILI